MCRWVQTRMLRLVQECDSSKLVESFQVRGRSRERSGLSFIQRSSWEWADKVKMGFSLFGIKTDQTFINFICSLPSS